MTSLSFVSDDEQDEILFGKEKEKKQHDLGIEEQLTQATVCFPFIKVKTGFCSK